MISMIRQSHAAGQAAAARSFIKASSVQDLLKHLAEMAAGPVSGAALNRYFPRVSKAMSNFGTRALDVLEVGPRAIGRALRRALRKGPPKLPAPASSDAPHLPKEPTILR